MTSPTRPAPRIFVSYSRKDSDFTQRLVSDLHAAGAEVWVDVEGIRHGNFMRIIDEAIAQCEWMVLILTPDAIASEYVREETFIGLHRTRQGFMRAVIPVMAAPCAPGTIPPSWDVLQRYDATRGYEAARDGLLRALGLALAPMPTLGRQTTKEAPPAQPAKSAPSSRQAPTQHIQPVASDAPITRAFRWLPQRLAELGFRAHEYDGTAVIVPPMCNVPAGAFLMGSDLTWDSQGGATEQPEHGATLPAFQIARFPVTVAEYACFVQAGGSEPTRWGYGARGKAVEWQTQLTHLDHPVVCVSWHDAMAYAAWLALLTGQPWELPSEPEWEKAARWDPVEHYNRIYPWGDAFDKTRCNTRESWKRRTTPVGSYPNGASPCGAQDMAGNVWEWTCSLMRLYPYRADDGRERADSPEYRALHRVLRGGSWINGSRFARAAERKTEDPSSVHGNVGFRLVLVVPGSS